MRVLGKVFHLGEAGENKNIPNIAAFLNGPSARMLRSDAELGTQVGPPAQRTHRQVQDAPAFAIV